MGVIVYLCESLGGSRVQLHDSLGKRRVFACSESSFNSQNGGQYYRRAVFYCAVLWAEEHNGKDIHKEMFPIHGWKCFSRKAVLNLVEKFSQGR
jgi:hypothetical protein